MLPIVLLNENSISDGLMEADLEGSAKEVKEAVRGSIQFIWTGTAPTGTGRVQGSNNGTNWDDISTFALSGNSGNELVNLESIGYAYLRAFFTFSSGTGTLNAIVCTKRN
jgi:hypothetical protein